MDSNNKEEFLASLKSLLIRYNAELYPTFKKEPYDFRFVSPEFDIFLDEAYEYMKGKEWD